jgi:hypothetical protein
VIQTETLQYLVQQACYSADGVAIDRKAEGATGAEVTRAVIARALEALEANGYITVVPPAEWPDWFVPEPPYEVPDSLRGGG